MNYPYYSIVDQIYHTEWTQEKLARLELLRTSIQTLWPQGHPTKLVHVAGTGGKGSTCRFLELGFSCLGNAGAFMSPHLFDYRERFSINGEFVSQADVAWAWETRVRPHCVQLTFHNRDHSHSFHEVSILIALTLFEKYQVAWAAMETGVGGRYDQTRALEVVASVLTNVGSDHAHILGKELWQRTLDKAGIARPGVPFFTSEAKAESLAIIQAVCDEAGAPLQVIDASTVNELTRHVTELLTDPVAPNSLLSATYQKWNATLAWAVVRQLCPQVDEGQVLAKFAGARLPGRFWQVGERTYADIAHNAEKMGAFAGAVRERFGDQGKIFVVGLSGARVPVQVFKALTGLAKTIIVTGASYKGQDPGQVRSEIASLLDTPTLVVDEPQQALQLAQTMQGEQDVIILTGSTYMIEQALNPDPHLRQLSATFGWRMRSDSEAHGTVQLTLPKVPFAVR